MTKPVGGSCVGDVYSSCSIDEVREDQEKHENASTFRRVFLTTLVLISVNQCCDSGWFLAGRFTDVHLWMVEIGILFWSVIGALILEKWMHKFIHNVVGGKRDD